MVGIKKLLWCFGLLVLVFWWVGSNGYAGTIFISSSDLKANPDGTYSYHDGYMPFQKNQDKVGEETVGGPVYSRLWRKLYETQDVLLWWQHNGGLSAISPAGWLAGNRFASITFKYQLPPSKVIEAGKVYCKFDYAAYEENVGAKGRAAGSVAAIRVSRDNKNWIEVFKFVGADKSWTNSPELPPRDSKKYAGTKYDLPKEVKGWQTLYVKCSISSVNAPSAVLYDIQMLRENWFEKAEHYSLDLVVRDKNTRF